MSFFQKLTQKKSPSAQRLWFERGMAILATVNFTWLLFDISYVPWRDFYFSKLPVITDLYDPIKGIETHRATQSYMNTVNALISQVEQTGLPSTQSEQLLQELRSASNEMIETNPFQEANKSGTLERIKNKMRTHLEEESAKKAFSTFWSFPYLTQKGFGNEIDFYKSNIQPLIASNYYRHIGENNQYIDNFFWRIDRFFCFIFIIEFILRTLYISRRHTGITWLDAMLWRWYDIFLIVPLYWGGPIWGLLRIIPVSIRLDRAKLINIERIRHQINQGIVANLAGEITEVVVVQVINQMQDSIKRGEISRWLLQPEKQPYIDLNNINEVEAIAEIIMKLFVYRIIPKIRPDVEAILRHNIESILLTLPAYQTLQAFPGLNSIPKQLTERLVNEISQATYEALTTALEDPVGGKLSAQLAQHFTEAIAEELKNQHTLEKLQSLVTDMLEEIKINYVERLSEADAEQIMEQTRKLRQLAHPEETKIIQSRRI